MLNGLFIASLIGGAVQLIKESTAPTVPLENWANEELMHKDMMDGVPIKQRMKNLENGKYRLSNNNVTRTHPEPHRDSNGKIIIENSLLFEEDKKRYGVVQTYKWVEQGRYNLTPEELEKENARIRAKLEHLYSL